MGFSRLLFHRIESHGISIDRYCGMETHQTIGSCRFNGSERMDVRLTCLRPAVSFRLDGRSLLFLPQNDAPEREQGREGAISQGMKVTTGKGKILLAGEPQASPRGACD